jgi:hypothetical protein
MYKLFTLFFFGSPVPNVCYLDASFPVDLKLMRGPFDWAMRCSIHIIFLTIIIYLVPFSYFNIINLFACHLYTPAIVVLSTQRFSVCKNEFINRKLYNMET